MHMIGTSYYMHKALEIDKEIKKLERVKNGNNSNENN